MMPELKYQLDGDAIARLSSEYIDQGIKRERWRITRVSVEGAKLAAELRMESVFLSPTDPAGFHLTIFSTQEFLAQLANIYLHLLAGSTVKNRETWMRESSITTHRAIRDPARISVEMDFFKVKRLKDSWYAMANCRVFDGEGGLFTANLKGILS
jgi:hypothetical protein